MCTMTTTKEIETPATALGPQLLGFDYNETECGALGDDCDQCCADCFRLLDGHCDECGTCWCDGADTGECQDVTEDEDGGDE